MTYTAQDARRTKRHTNCDNSKHMMATRTAKAPSAMQALCIKTVYDLATSTVFGTATNISAAAGKDAQDTLYGKLNSVPKHLFDSTRLQHAQLGKVRVVEEAKAGMPRLLNQIRRAEDTRAHITVE